MITKMPHNLARSAGSSAFETLKNNPNAELLWHAPNSDGRPAVAVWRASDAFLEDINLNEIRIIYHMAGSTRVAGFENGSCRATSVKTHSIAVTSPGNFRWEIRGELMFAHVYLWPEAQLSAKPDPSLTLHNSVYANDKWLQGFFSMLLSYQANERILQGRFIRTMTLPIIEHLQSRYGSAPLLDRKIIIQGGLSNESLFLIQEHLKNNLTKSVSVSDLARIAKCSESHFHRAFKESTGRSPHQYLLDLKIETAKEQLMRSSASISDIGKSVGYKQAGQFSAAFNKRVGLTPSEFRKSFLETN